MLRRFETLWDVLGRFETFCDAWLGSFVGKRFPEAGRWWQVGGTNGKTMVSGQCGKFYVASVVVG